MFDRRVAVKHLRGFFLRMELVTQFVWQVPLCVGIGCMLVFIDQVGNVPGCFFEKPIGETFNVYFIHILGFEVLRIPSKVLVDPFFVGFLL